jgi:hypothetical protein
MQKHCFFPEFGPKLFTFVNASDFFSIINIKQVIELPELGRTVQNHSAETNSA